MDLHREYSTEQVERVASALFLAEQLLGDVPFDEASDQIKTNYRELAKVAIRSLREPMQHP